MQAAVAGLEAGMGKRGESGPPPRDRKLRPSLVEDVITDYCDNSPAELARRLTRIVGKEVHRSMVHGWRLRGQFPPEFVPAVHRLTKLPLLDLIERNRPRFKIPTQR